MIERGGRPSGRASILCGVLLCCASAGLATAQSVGNATGVITDEEGTPIAGAFVILEGYSIAAISDPDGSYAVTGIPAGKQRLVVTYVSYRTVRRDVTIVGDGTITVHVTLFIDPLDLERVVVTGTPNPRVKLESSVAITTRNSDEIVEDAPLSTTALLSVVPGFWSESSGGQTGGNLFARGLPQDGSYRYVAMYEDGMPVFESSALSFANIDTFYRVDDSVEVLEAVRGGSAAVFASNSPGGLVNFISKTGGEVAAGSIRFTAGSYGLFRGDFNYGGPVGENWRYNVGGFYRFDSGVRDPDFQANKGGQIRMNATRIFADGYVRFYFKALEEQNTFYLPIPLQDADNPKSIPGVNANFGTMTSLDAALVRVPTGDGLVRTMDLRDGVNPRVLSLGLEFFHELDNDWSIKNNTRFTEIELNYNAMFSGAPPASTADYAADKLQQFNDKYPDEGATTARYRFSTSGEIVSDPATLNGNGLALEYGWWNVQKPMSSLTNDLQLTRNFETHDLTLGLYVSTYRAEDFRQFNNVLLEARNAPRLLDLEFLDASGGTVVGTATQNGFTQYGSRYVRADNSATVVALYANDDWEISNRWRLDAGIRFETADYDGNTEVTAQYDISDTNPLSEAPVGGNTPLPTLADSNLQWGTGQVLSYNWTFSDWAASVGANYSVSERLAVYGRLSKGFRQPTFDRWSVLAPGSTTITKGESEDVQQAEAGVKMSTANLGLFAALFYSRLDNVVFDDEVLDSDDMLVPRDGEASTETPGAEIEVVYRPGALWLLEGMLTLQRAKYRDFVQQDGVTRRDFSGNRVRRIPDAILNFRPTFQLGRFKTFLNWQHVGERYSDDANTVKLPAYDKIDLGVIFAQARTTYALHATNLFNEVGLTEANPRSGQVVGTESDVYLARPILGRAIRVSVGYRF